MSTPNIEAELAEQDFKLHQEAGLVYSGKNYDGETEWIGTKKQWELYEQMKEAD